MDLLRALIGILVAIGFIIPIVMVINGLLETQRSAKIDEETQSSFDELVRVIKKIEVGDVESSNIIVKIKSSFLIVGFNEGATFLRDIVTPCKGESCLCICAAEPYGESSCLKYKDSCVKFDSISKFKTDSKSIFENEKGKGFEISQCTVPCKFKISGDEKSIEIRDNE